MQEHLSARQTVRRLYLYVISGISLAIMAIGAINLLGLALDAVLSAVTGHDWVQSGPDWARNRLSLYIPLVAIATPIWLIHWGMIRHLRGGASGEVERRSRIRAVYLTLALAFTLVIIWTNVYWILPVIAERIFGRTLEPFERNDMIQNLAMSAILACIWVFHWRTRNQDVRDGPLEGVAVWLPRLYLYAASALGAIPLMLGASKLISVAGKAIVGSGESGKWWNEPLASGLGLALAGAVFWTIHWTHSVRLLKGDAWWARSERGSRLRAAYLIGLLVLASVLTLIYYIDGIERAVWELLDTTQISSRSAQLREIAGPLVAAMPFVVVWLFHRLRLFAEARAFGDDERVATSNQLYDYSVSFAGLVIASLGLVELLWVVNLWLGGVANSAPLGMGGWQGQVALGFATTVSGGSLWLWHWSHVQRRMTLEPAAEQASIVRRSYLFIALGSAIVPLIISLAIVVYQLLQRGLGVAEAGSLAKDLGWPLAIALVTTVAAIYHGVLLRRDLLAKPGAVAPEPVATPSRLAVVITGPAGADLPALLPEIRGRLPEGYDIRVAEGGTMALVGSDAPNGHTDHDALEINLSSEPTQALPV